MKNGADYVPFELIRMERFFVEHHRTKECLGEIRFGRCKCCAMPAAVVTGWQHVADDPVTGVAHLIRGLTTWWTAPDGAGRPLPEMFDAIVSEANGGSTLLVTLGCRHHQASAPSD